MERRYNKERAASSEAASNEGIRMARQSGVALGVAWLLGGRREGRGRGQDLLDPLVAANFARDAFSKTLKRYNASTRDLVELTSALENDVKSLIGKAGYWIFRLLQIN